MTHNRIIHRTTKNKIGVVTLVIPRKFAQELGLLEPTEVIVEKLDQGLLVRKLEV